MQFSHCKASTCILRSPPSKECCTQGTVASTPNRIRSALHATRPPDPSPQGRRVHRASRTRGWRNTCLLFVCCLFSDCFRRSDAPAVPSTQPSFDMTRTFAITAARSPGHRDRHTRAPLDTRGSYNMVYNRV